MRLHLAAMVLLFALLANASTITDTIKNRYGTPVKATVTFTPKDSITFTNGAVYLTSIVSTNSASDGVLSVEVVTGTYLVTIGLVPEDKFTIAVPNTAGPFTLLQLKSP